ncbi:protein NRT1/ PTR FAMILY 2.7 isoform X3 [Jatropha curcas]|nr:protein NRT1/ PTR FAMILY 2.7 isoform X3 [Jatropha curcas]
MVGVSDNNIVALQNCRTTFLSFKTYSIFIFHTFHLQATNNKALMADPETGEVSSSAAQRRGNWIPFIIGTLTCLTLAGTGWVSNLTVYLIQEFNVETIDAALISNVVYGAFSLFPIVGAIVADSFLGSFSVVAISSCVSFLGIVLLALTATLDSLRPKPCRAEDSSLCQTPSKLQYTVLYGAFALGSLGLGGTRFTIATMGANQFDKQEDQTSFFNWYFFTLYFSSLISATAIVYIEDNVSWSLGFWLCAAANFIGIVSFLLGNRLYRLDKPHGSPFTSLARVVIAAIRKRKALLSSTSDDYYFEQDLKGTQVSASITESFSRFFNRAALKVEGETNPDGSIAKSWKLCTVQQVEDLKTLIRIFPIWSTALFVCTPIAMQSSLTVLQALTMDRRLGHHFKIPAGSISIVVGLISCSIFLTINDRFLFRMWQKLTRKPLTLFQRIGIGHVLNVLGMAVSALVESRRLRVAHAQYSDSDKENSRIVPMLVLWLFPQLILVGVGEAFHFPGQVSFYYQEFPDSLRSTATAMLSLITGISFYAGTALIDLIRRVTDWLPDNIDHGRLDNVYWVLTVVGILNFCYYLCCAKFYKFENVQKAIESELGCNKSSSG